MEGHRRDGAVVVGGGARQQFHEARGYGRPTGSEVALAPVEAAHLLFRGDLAAVDGQDFREFFESARAEDPALAARFAVYADLRGRGFYLVPAREGWIEDPPRDADFAVFERGAAPPDGPVAHRIRVVGERAAVAAGSLGDVVLAVADEEGEVTYFETDTPDPEGSTGYDPPAITATLAGDRAIVWDPPADLYRRGFYGQPLGGRDRDPDEAPLQLSLVEAAHLAREGALDLDPGVVREAGRSVEGERFDRRLAAYTALRERGVVPKTGFKFGADFRAYRSFSTVGELDHSEDLVLAVAPDHAFTPRELALDVRLAGGVRKRLVVALTDGEAVEWLSVARLTP